MNQKKFFVFKKYSSYILYGCILFFVVVMSAIGFWKYHNFLYNALDFAIFNQTFFNTSIGNLFGLTIHPPTYLNDHFSPMLAILTIPYALFKHPLFLVVLQNIFLAITAFPLFLISKLYFSKSISLLIALSFLLNPFVLNVSLFEFHMLPFSLVFIFFALYFFLKNQFTPFVIFCALAMLVREDVSLVIFMIGILALIEKKGIRWILFPLIASSLYFLFGLKIIELFSVEQNYKFLIYYSWIFEQPFFIFKKLFSLPHLEMLLGLLLPFAFIPLVRLRYLLLALPIYLQLTLGSGGASGLILQTQYSTLFLPALFLAFIFGIKKIQTKKSHGRIMTFLQKEKILFGILIAVAVVYSSLTLGPLVGTFKKMTTSDVVQQKREMIQQIPDDASVVAGYDFLLPLSSRKNIYSLNYVFIGQQQFNKRPYLLPEDVEYIVFDAQEFLTYEAQYKNHFLYGESYNNAHENFIRQLKENNFLPIVQIGSNILFKKNATDSFKLYFIQTDVQNLNVSNSTFNNDIALVNAEVTRVGTRHVLSLQTQWHSNKTTNKNYHPVISIKNKNGDIVYSKMFPMAYGLFPTKLWEEGSSISTSLEFNINKKIPSGTYDVFLGLSEIKRGGMFIESNRSTSPRFVTNEIETPQKIGGISF